MRASCDRLVMPAPEGGVEVAKMSALGRTEFCDQLMMSAMGVGREVLESFRVLAISGPDSLTG